MTGNAGLMVIWAYRCLPVRIITTDDSLEPEGFYSEWEENREECSGLVSCWDWVVIRMSEMPFVLFHGGSVQWQVVAQW